MTEKLKPCPFCGYNEELRIGFEYPHFAIYCDVCSNHGPIEAYEQEAIEAWNKRDRKD